MKYLSGCILALLVFSLAACAQNRELRAVWYTPRIGSGFATQAQIAAAIDSLANNNFNTVMFNTWTQGYPLWRSEVFRTATGGEYRSDPKAGDRDILAEAIAEAHRRGLEIEAWFEYGFVGGYSGNRPTGSRRGALLDRHPDWLGRSVSGADSVVIAGTTQSHFWMSHVHPGVQQFLIALTAELADRYDLDAIELDRIRYPGDDWGYDSVTVALYKAELGSPPPPAISDAGWKRWRADKLNTFHKALYDTVKRHHPQMLVTNAPSHYASGNSYPAYNSFNQDWVAWLNGGYVDAAHLQQYTPPANFTGYVNSWMQYLVTDASKQKKVFPSIAVRLGSIQLTSAELIQEINTVRERGLSGSPIWYYEYLNGTENGKTFWWYLRNGPYSEPAIPPLRKETNWRTTATLISQRDRSASDTTGEWTVDTGVPGYFGDAFTARSLGVQTITYSASVKERGWYDVYAYIVGRSGLSSRAPYELCDSSGLVSKVAVDQSNSNLAGWTIIGAVFLGKDRRQVVVRLSNAGIEETRSVAAGGIMLVLNRRRGVASLATNIGSLHRRSEEAFSVSEAYPNPSNPTFTVAVWVGMRCVVRAELFDLLGRMVRVPLEGRSLDVGQHALTVDASGLSSGIYLLKVSSPVRSISKRILVLR